MSSRFDKAKLAKPLFSMDCEAMKIIIARLFFGTSEAGALGRFLRMQLRDDFLPHRTRSIDEFISRSHP